MSEHIGSKLTTRRILHDGIRLNGSIYQSPELQQLYLANPGQPVQIMYDPADLTSIYVHAKHNPTKRYIHVPRTNLEGLSLHPRWKQQQTRSVQFIPEWVHLSNEHWSMDFVSDILVNGQIFRALVVVDDVRQFSPAIEVRHSNSISTQHVLALLERLKATHGLPERLTVDNGREFISRALNDWADRNGVNLEFRQSATPATGSFIKSFTHRFCKDCLNQHVFHSIEEAQTIIEMWRQNYNTNDLRA